MIINEAANITKNTTGPSVPHDRTHITTHKILLEIKNPMSVWLIISFNLQEI